MDSTRAIPSSVWHTVGSPWVTIHYFKPRQQIGFLLRLSSDPCPRLSSVLFHFSSIPTPTQHCAPLSHPKAETRRKYQSHPTIQPRRQPHFAATCHPLVTWLDGGSPMTQVVWLYSKSVLSEQGWTVSHRSSGAATLPYPTLPTCPAKNEMHHHPEPWLAGGSGPPDLLGLRLPSLSLQTADCRRRLWKEGSEIGQNVQPSILLFLRP